MASNKRLNATIVLGGAMSGTLRSALGTTKNKLGEIGDTIRRLSREQRMLGDAIQTFGRMGKNVDGLRTKYAAVTAELEKQRRVQERLAAVEQRRERLTSQRDNLRGKLLGATATAAAVAVPVGAAFKRASDFQYELQLIGNTADMSASEVVKLGATIMDASKKTGQSAQDMQKAVGFLVAAGLDAKVAAAAVQQIGRTATASGADIEDLSKAAFTLMDSLKIKPGQDLQDALDTLAQAGKEGNVELRDMAKTLPVLGSGFLALKMGGREAAATMGAALEIARKGAADADEAANNMRNYIAKIMSPETLKKAEKNFNLDLYKIITDAQTQGKNPFEESMKAIIKATKGDQKAIGDLFQDMQVQNFIRPMIQNWDEYLRIKETSLNASGVTDRDYEKVMATAKKQTDDFFNAVGRLSIAIGDSLIPAFGELSKRITPVIESVTAFVKEHPTLVGNAVILGGALVTLRAGMFALQLASTSARLATVGLAGSLNTLPGAAAGAAKGISGFIGKLGAVGLLSGVALEVARAAGLPDTDEQRGRDAMNRGDWWEASKYLPAGDFISGAWKNVWGSGDKPKEAPPPPPLPFAETEGGAAVGARRRGAGKSYQDNSQNNFNITQLPGENAEQLARRIADEMERQRQVRERGMMFDGAYAQ